MATGENTLNTARRGSVVSHAFSERLLDKKIQALTTPDFKTLDPKGLFDIPWKDIVCFKDSANISKADPIEIGTIAQAALDKLFIEFGITGMPQTWGELMGAVAYCTKLHANCNYPRISASDDASWFSSCMKVTRKYSPELVTASLAYHEGKKEALVQIFEEQLGFEKCSYHFVAGFGWDSHPDEK